MSSPSVSLQPIEAVDLPPTAMLAVSEDHLEHLQADTEWFDGQERGRHCRPPGEMTFHSSLTFSTFIPLADEGFETDLRAKSIAYLGYNSDISTVFDVYKCHVNKLLISLTTSNAFNVVMGSKLYVKSDRKPGWENRPVVVSVCLTPLIPQVIDNIIVVGVPKIIRCPTDSAAMVNYRDVWEYPFGITKLKIVRHYRMGASPANITIYDGRFVGPLCKLHVDSFRVEDGDALQFIWTFDSSGIELEQNTFTTEVWKSLGLVDVHSRMVGYMVQLPSLSLEMRSEGI